jgi:hypothetical protein
MDVEMMDEVEDPPAETAFLQEEAMVWRPFVAPMVVPSAGSAQKQQQQQQLSQIHLTPRLVSYYEVSILAPPVVVVNTMDTPACTSVPTSRRLVEERDEFCRDSAVRCVAVGLATDQFPLYARLPGWEPDSFGYHGDDGGIYHELGHAVRQYGPLFGAGDVVGCGIDYLAGAIFYTLNGQFMGYAFENLPSESLQQDWYPTVGLDNTNWPVQCNFGCEQPFVFDLTTIMEGHKERVKQTIIDKILE